MTQSVALLGRQPALGIAELESLFGAEKLTIAGQNAVILDISPDMINFARLGGTMKLGQMLTTLNTTDWGEIQAWLTKTVPHHLQYLPEGKLQLGMSVYGLGVNVTRINASGLELKKVIRSAGRSVRLIPNKTPELNSAQVLHNHLTGPTGWEFLFIRDGNRTHVAQTVAVQDINAYAARDQVRPKRDARVGMLPPKLAQLIINLAVGNVESSDLRSQSSEVSSKIQDPRSKIRLLDPFCGTGVILQESLLMGYDIYGTDLEPRMIDYSSANLTWLMGSGFSWELEAADATSTTWRNFDVLAAETYLGRPFSALPKPEILQEVIQDVNTIHRKFLQNVARQTKPGLRMCIAVPAWKTTGSELRSQSSDGPSKVGDPRSKINFQHLPVLDQLTDLGYTRTSFAHVSNRDLIYHRPEQIVARELISLTRK